MHVALRKRDLNRRSSKRSIDREAEDLRRAQVGLRLGKSHEQGEVEAGVAETFEADLERAGRGEAIAR